MESRDFHCNDNKISIQNCVDLVFNEFLQQKRDLQVTPDIICKNIFCVPDVFSIREPLCGGPTHPVSLFRLLLSSATARPYSVNMDPYWGNFKGLFCNYDEIDFSKKFPITVRTTKIPSNNLIKSFKSAARNIRKFAPTFNNSWNNFLASAQTGAHYLANLKLTCNDRFAPLTPKAYAAICKFNLGSINLTDLTLGGASHATDGLRSVRGIAFATAMNFLRDGGCPNAFKPDTHTKETLSMAFSMLHFSHPIGPKNDAGLTSDFGCFQAALGFLKSLSGFNVTCCCGLKHPMTLASFDRLVWSASSGKLPTVSSSRLLSDPNRNKLQERISENLRRSVLSSRY